MEKEYYIGQIFDGIYPPEVADWCNMNKAYIVENDEGKYEIRVIPAPTEERIKSNRIGELEALLASKDYIGVKIATGCATVEDYAEEIAQCEEWRKEIRELKK